MRAVLFILIVIVVAVLIALATGFIQIHQTRDVRAPNVSATRQGVAASGGQTPTFDIETGSVAVGTSRKNVAVPVVKVTPANQVANTATNNAR